MYSKALGWWPLLERYCYDQGNLSEQKDFVHEASYVTHDPEVLHVGSTESCCFRPIGCLHTQTGHDHLGNAVLQQRKRYVMRQGHRY